MSKIMAALISISFSFAAIAIWFCPYAALGPKEQVTLYFGLTIVFLLEYVKLACGK